MHPSIALQVAELELERDKAPHGHLDPEEEQRWKEMQMKRPATFLHFGPRWHQQRRTMTGVLAGYFDQPPRRKEPLPTIPGAQHLLARTAAPAMTEEELERMELENKKRRRVKAVSKRVREIANVTDVITSDDVADLVAGVVVAEDLRRGKGGRSTTNRSSSRSRSDSPLTTDSKLVSDESTPPLTPMSSTSSFRQRSDEEKVSGSGKHEAKTSKAYVKKQKRALQKPLTFDEALALMPTTNAIRDTVNAEKATNATSTSGAGSGAGENKTTASTKTATTSRKRKFSEVERPLQRSRATTTASTKEQQTKAQQEEQKEQQRQRRKSRPGWKGWVEVEGSPEPMTKLINLDFPIETLEKRTRSGKIVPNGSSATPGTGTGRTRDWPSIARSSTGASVTPVGDGPPASSELAFEAQTGAIDGPLGDLRGNTPVAAVRGDASAEV